MPSAVPAQAKQSTGREIRNKVIYSVITIVLGIMVYSIIGVLTYCNSTAICDKFPQDFFCDAIKPEQSLTVSIRNNAPLSLPFINPFYSLHTDVEAENEAFVYFIGLGDEKCNFTEWGFDLGRIDAGHYDETTLYLHVDEGNLTLRIDVYLIFIVPIRATSASYFVEYEGNGNYTIARL